MARAGGYDTVSALSENDATGEVADIFADIRATMQIPLVTSIWRVLAGVEDGLPAVWSITKPFYSGGHPEAALARFRQTTTFPSLGSLSLSDLDHAGVNDNDLASIRQTIDAYNRSNTLNFLVLSALITDAMGEAPEDTVRAPLPPWGELPVLLDGDDIAETTWETLRAVNRFENQDAHMIGTLWRHIAHWPELLVLAQARMHPMQRDGTIPDLARHAIASVASEAGQLAHLRTDPVEMPAAAHKIITAYVRDPEQLARMVSIGQGLADWLAADNIL